MFKKWLRNFIGIDNELRGQKLLNAQLLKENKELEKRIVSMAIRLKQVENVLGINIDVNG